MRLLYLILLSLLPASTYAAEAAVDLIGNWTLEEIRCANDEKKAKLSFPESFSDSWTFSKAGEFRREFDLGPCTNWMNGQYQVSGNKIDLNGTFHVCNPKNPGPPVKEKPDFAIKNDRLHLIWRENSRPKDACIEGPLEWIYVKLPAADS